MNALKLTFKTLVVLSSFVLSSLALAAPLSVSGVVKSQNALPANLRIAVFLTDRSGNPSKEISSATINNGAYSLSIAETAPSTSGLQNLVQDLLDWPGLIGKINITGSARIARTAIRAYLDANNDKSFSSGDTLFESFVTKGRGSIVIVYSDAKTRIKADRGFDVTLEPGWNLVQIELGNPIKVARVASVENVQIEVLATPGYISSYSFGF
jgi:protein-disulfide isomerase